MLIDVMFFVVFTLYFSMTQLMLKRGAVHCHSKVARCRDFLVPDGLKGNWLVATWSCISRLRHYLFAGCYGGAQKDSSH